MFERFKRKQPIQDVPQQRIRRPRDDCKIKIKKTSDGGKVISFSGSCRKEQLEMARFMNNADKIEEE